MPFKSDAQRRWAHTADGIAALGGPAKVAEWDAASKGMKLPAKVGAKRVRSVAPNVAPKPKKARLPRFGGPSVTTTLLGIKSPY